MNKLYKYLPFGISFKDIDSDDIFELVSIGVHNEVVGLFKNKERVGFIANEVLPILRPFEDLVVELPLTKAAAEMIGLKEGVLVNPLVMMFRYNNKLTGLEFQNVNAIKDVDIFIVDLNTETKYVKVDVDIEIDSNFNFSINSYALQKKEKHRVASCYYTINPTCLDFLRAMCFNLDFKEGEYIKLTD